MPASLAELKAALPKAPADFLLSQLEAGAEVSTAAVAYANQLEAKLAAVPTAPAKPAGVVPSYAPHSSNAGAGSADAIGEFDQLVRDMRTRNPQMDRQTAVKTVALNNPDAHQAYLMATNPNARARRLIAEKLDA